jgi:hypothetical protein
MLEAARISETLVQFTRSHIATTQKTAISILCKQFLVPDRIVAIHVTPAVYVWKSDMLSHGQDV